MKKDGMLTGRVGVQKHLLLSPLVLTADLILFLRGEVVLDVEGLANLFRRLALDHVGNGFATDIQKTLDIKIVGGLLKHWVSFDGS